MKKLLQRRKKRWKRVQKLKWLPGRQGTDYHKLCFFSFKLGKWGFDAYLLRYEIGYLPLHIDPIKGAKHYRMNIRLWGGCSFGIMGGEIFRIGQFLHFFRPDLHSHCLVIWKKTLKLSIGVAKYN